MGRLGGFAVKYLGRIVGLCAVAAVVAIIGLISEVVGIVEQVPVQRGIDQHTVQLTATYTDRISAKVPLGDDTYVLAYSYDGRDLTTPLRGLPGNPEVGDELCVEIDSAQPEHGRVCGTRGGLGDAESGLIWGGSLLAVVAGIALLYFASIRSLRREGRM